MFKTILSMLFKTAPKPPPMNSFQAAPSAADQAIPDIVEYYKAEIANSPFVKESGRGAVLKDFLHEVKLKDGELLTLEEKRLLGISTRLKITRELYEVLTPEGIEFGPKKVLEPLYLKATFNRNRHRDIARMKKIGVTQYSPLSCGDNRDCEWCISVNGKLISVDVDFVQLIEDNCTCDYCRCVLQAKINY
jgi:hypothetical protein